MLLFDLGGVLVRFDGIPAVVELSGGSLGVEDVQRYWLSSTWIRKFETGRCRAAEFAAGVVADLRLPLEAEEFLHAFESWERGPLPGALELLEALGGRFTLACLSNNNEVHWRRIAATGIAEKFQHCYLSHQIGRMKPDSEVFDHVVADLNVAPGEILFFDDNPSYVEAARQRGLAAARTVGPEQVGRALADLGITTGRGSP